MYDAVIIGGGLAGSLAARRLATHGWKVAVVEQHQFARGKVCGECLSALGIETLKRSGLADSVLDVAPARLTRAFLHAADASSEVSLRGEMWGVSRTALDALLLNAARGAGAEILQPARAELIRAGEVVIRDLRTNEQKVITARQILLADGKGALLTERPAATSDFGIKAHFIGVEAERDAIGLYGVGQSYGGVAPIEGDRWNAAFSVSVETLSESRGRLDELFESIQRQNPTLRLHFRRARRVGEWCSSPLPRFGVMDEWPAGVIPIGNAAGALEPIGGEGMGLALRSAELAVEAMLENPERPNLASLRREYRKLWTIRRFACRTAALALSSPTFARPTVELLAGNEMIASIALRLMGKRAVGG